MGFQHQVGLQMGLGMLEESILWDQQEPCCSCCSTAVLVCHPCYSLQVRADSWQKASESHHSPDDFLSVLSSLCCN